MHPAADPPAPPAAVRPLHVVGLGDSVMSGYGCDCDLVADYARLVAAAWRRPVVPMNLGTSGLTSAGLLAVLSTGSQAASVVAGSDIVVVTIGANDLRGSLASWQRDRCDLSCFTHDLESVRRRVLLVLDRIAALRAGRPTQILVTDYWNVFEDGQRALGHHGAAYLDLARAVTDRAATALCAAAAARSVTCVDLIEPFHTAPGGVDALLQEDGDHPNAQGALVIARTLAARTRPPSTRPVP